MRGVDPGLSFAVMPCLCVQGHPHATLAYLLVEAADVEELQRQLQEQQGREGAALAAAATAAGPSRPHSSLLLRPLMQRCRLGQAAGRAKEAAGKLLEQQRDNVGLVASLAAVQAMMGKTTVRRLGWGLLLCYRYSRFTHLLIYYSLGGILAYIVWHTGSPSQAGWKAGQGKDTWVQIGSTPKRTPKCPSPALGDNNRVPGITGISHPCGNLYLLAQCARDLWC